MTAERRWAVVTGASRGIGAATSVALAAAGCDVLVHYGADRAGAEKTAAACEEVGAGARVVGADLADDIAPLLRAMDDVGGVGVVVANAGVAHDSLAVSTDDESLARMWQVNVAGAFSVIRHALRPMLRRRHGRIVALSSVIGLHGNAGQAGYAASKAALVGMTKSLAREVGKRGITANVVAPGFVATAMTAGLDDEALVARIPAGRIGTPEEIAAAVVFLCSEPAAYVNGTVLQVDGGLFA